MPLAAESVKDFENLCQSALGFANSKKQKGWISAEWMISHNENEGYLFHMWECWESKEDFENYMRSPERVSGSYFEQSIRKCASGNSVLFWGKRHIV